jgi:hypothetical protein
LFCFVVMRSTKPGCFRSMFLVSLESSRHEGCMGLDPWCLDLQCKSS